MSSKLILLMVAVAGAGLGADQATIERGQKEEARSCIPCHSLRLIHSQRLSRAAWTRELDKMGSWGTVITDREALLEYLMANYGDDKPLPVAATSSDGTAKKGK